MDSDAPRRLQVDVSKLDLDKSLTEALRLLAAPDGGMPTYLHEAARIVTDVFDELDLDASDDETLNALAHRIVEIIAGLTLAGYGAASFAANVADVDRLEVLRDVEASIREEPGEDGTI